MTTPVNHALAHPITEDDIANYLANTPDFFQRHAELLATVQFTSPHSHRAVSLQERQAEMLREKIKLLEQRIMEMIRNGNENVMLSDKILRWARTLFLTNDLQALPAQIVQEIQDQFAVPQVGLRLWDVAAAYAGLPCAQGVSDDAKVFAASLTEPFCGLNTGFEAVGWLDDTAHVSSLALIPLRSGEGGGSVFGILVLASSDAHRFNSGMGTDFLARIGDLASAALSRLR
ncbi:DUF484 family protein [Rhodoferax saidenbachensis]|uniref:Uncharacterized protein YigA (DUF484 family) n=1 Tax=Rhodoferax saidenbachensis TaxID=1484693 RepID=A0ABU1ZLX5_9BURK|nr:DUF484 family protein [Rhodoferax saidenbachensis]MDR7305966.1 uncharacterized protein YigA (DUF484 family) [Rhodoferax saidenbachensis]